MLGQYWPQLVMIFLLIYSLGASLVSHDKPKTGKENFWISAIAVAIMFTILYFGNFFDGMW